MATTIITKNGSGAPVAGDLVQGELAVDLTNKTLYSKDSSGNVFKVGDTGGGSPGTFTDLVATDSFTSPGIDDNATSTAITIDANENVGIGTDPSSWAAGFPAIDLGDLLGFSSSSTGTYTTTNAYYSDRWRAKEDGYGVLHGVDLVNNTEYSLYSSASVLAGEPLTFSRKGITTDITTTNVSIDSKVVIGSRSDTTPIAAGLTVRSSSGTTAFDPDVGTEDYAAIVYHNANQADKNGLLVSNNWYNAASKVLSVGHTNASNGTYLPFYEVTGHGGHTWGSNIGNTMTLTNAGKVGVGTDIFGNAAQVLVAKGDASVSTSDANASGFNFTAVPDTTTGKVGIGFKTHNETASAVAALYATPVSQYRNGLTARYNADSQGGYFSIEQLMPQTASVVERFRIDAGGNAKIVTDGQGTTTSKTLQWGDALFNRADITVTNVSTYAADMHFSTGNNTNYNKRMTINSLGNVTIADTNAYGAGLRVAGSPSDSANFSFITSSPVTGLAAGSTQNMAYFANERSPSSPNDGLRIYSERDTTASGDGNWETESFVIGRNVDNVAPMSSIAFGKQRLTVATSGADRLIVDGNGNVGINGTPGTFGGGAAKLQVAGDGYFTNPAGLSRLFVVGGVSSGGVINLGDTADSNCAALQGTVDAFGKTMAFYSGAGGPKAYLREAGELLINTSSLSAVGAPAGTKLAVAGTAYFTGTVTAPAFDGTLVRSSHVIQDGAPVVDSLQIIRAFMKLRDAVDDPDSSVEELRDKLKVAVVDIIDQFQDQIDNMPTPLED